MFVGINIYEGLKPDQVNFPRAGETSR